jgi:hypothetical protein
MAGDWIKMRASLCTHPKVGLIAEIIGESTEIGKRLSTGFDGCLDEIVTRDVTRDVTIASLLRVWCATNEHTHDGVWQHSTLRSIDSAAGIQGFGEAMEQAGWLVVDEEAGTVTLPNFLEYNSPSKGGARSPEAARQLKYRQKLKQKRDGNDDVTRDVTRDVTVTPREEKRREEKNISIARSSRFSEFWLAWPATDRKSRKSECEKKWKAKGLDSIADQILPHIEACKATRKWQEGYEPAPLTYLNGRLWEDGPIVADTRQDDWTRSAI